jgi:hypothetical protein
VLWRTCWWIHWELGEHIEDLMWTYWELKGNMVGTRENWKKSSSKNPPLSKRTCHITLDSIKFGVLDALVVNLPCWMFIIFHKLNMSTSPKEYFSAILNDHYFILFHGTLRLEAILWFFVILCEFLNDDTL